MEPWVLVVTFGIANQTRNPLDIQIEIFFQQYDELERSTGSYYE